MSDEPTPHDAAQEPEETPPLLPKKKGFFARLFGKELTGNELTIAIAPFIDAAGQDHARELASVFQNIEGIVVKTFREVPVLNPEADRGEQLPAACAQAMGWISTMKADVVLWGDIPPPGTTFFIHFAAPPPIDRDTAGTISPFQALNLPIGFDPESLGGLLIASALAAMNITSKHKAKTEQALVTGALERAAQAISRIPNDFTMREKASVQAAFANALATFGHLFPGREVYASATEAYTAALQGTLRTENPVNWAYLQRNLGTAWQALSERSDEVETLQEAAAAYRLALDVFSLETTPFPWATTQNRLGEVLYRMDNASGETDGLKEALVAFQAALKVFTLSSTPLLWSDTMNNLGQSAQVLAHQIGNVEVMERAVTACEQALKARTIEAHPALWAASQNTMGSALFLLGRMTSIEDHYENAVKAFVGARDVYETLGLTRMIKLTEKNIQHVESLLPEKISRPKNDDKSMWWLAEDDDDDEDAR